MNRYIRTALLLLLVGCAKGGGQQARQAAAPPAQPTMLEQILRAGRLRVGLSTFVPWAMLDKGGQLIGFEVEVAERLAQDMGVELELVPTDWSGIIPALLAGKFDLIIGGMSITPQRNLQVNFSRPYAYSSMALAAGLKEKPQRPQLADFNQPQVVLAVRSGASSVAAAKRLLPRAQLRRFDSEAQLIQEVVNGRAAGFVSANPLPRFTVIDRSDAFYLPAGGESFAKEPNAFALVKGEHDYLNFLNNWILLRESDGFLQQRHDYWFASKDWQSRVK